MPSPEGKNSPGGDASNEGTSHRDTSRRDTSRRDASSEDTSIEDPASADAPGAGTSGAEASEMGASTEEDPDGETAVEEGSSADEDLPDQEKTRESAEGENASRDSSVDSSSGDSTPGDGARTVECVNCGRRFTGNYCPKCGQEADPAVSATEVIGGFFRELVDVEGGLWPTFVGLTLRPGTVLRDYLSGVRAGMVGPGRYLLTAVVISFGVGQGLVWLGLLQGPEASFSGAIPEEASEEIRQTMEAFFEVVGQVTQSQWGNVAIALVFTGFLSLFFWRLFRGRVHRWSEALAISAFTVGHWAVLGAGLLLLIVVFEYLTGGTPASTWAQTVPLYLLAFAYPGAVAYGLGSGWKTAAQGALSGAWAFVESSAIFGLSTAGYFLWQVRLLGGLSGEEKAVFAAIVALYLAPLLLHAVAELFYRLR